MTIAFHSSRNETSTYSYSSAFASSSVANFTSKASPLPIKSSFSPSSSANVKLNSHRSPSLPPSPSPSSSLRFSIEQQPKSPGRRSMTATKDTRSNKTVSSNNSRPCMCSPTSHPGSFRCAYHKKLAEQEQQRKQKQLQQQQQQQRQQKVSSRSRTLNLRRSAMNNSLVLIGGVEGEMVKRTLTTLIRPSPLQLRRREGFQAKPSRLSVMSKAEES